MASAIIVRGNAGVAATLRSVIAALDPALPVVVRSFDRPVADLAARPRFEAWLLVSFTGFGMLLAAFGLYGLVSFLVAQRQREFGVRMALGATQSDILRLVLGDALSWTLGGLVCGLAGAAFAARTLRSMLFHVSPADPAAYVTAAVMLSALAVVAALLPSMRAARVDPAITLRHD